MGGSHPRISASETKKKKRNGEYALPRTTLLLRLRDDSQVGDVRYGGQGLSAESICREMGEVRELGYFGGRETVREYRKV